MTNGAKNHPQDKAKNLPQDAMKNHPDIIRPVRLQGVVDGAALRALLEAKSLSACCSRVRVGGLLLLIDYICRNLKGNGMIAISADLAHSFVSKLRNRSSVKVVCEPLLLLCEIGILRRIRPAVFAHVKTSAVYCLADPYCKVRRLEFFLTPKLLLKRASADDRRERRLNRKYRFRRQLLADLATVRFLDSARPIIGNGLLSKGDDNLKRLVNAIDAQGHFVLVSERGQITTSLGSCPRQLRPHLLLGGEPVVSCDISNAHWNFLPLILANRLDYASCKPRRVKYVNDGWREHHRLIALLSQCDFYCAWCRDPKNDTERKKKKGLLNILLNKKNTECQRNRLYRRIAAEFPITFAVLEDIKRNDHRNLSKQLHRFTADVIAAALLEVQQKGIAAIPHVDALICQEKYHKPVCEIIGRKIFEAAGVCCTVGGIRYSPLTEIEEQALILDEADIQDIPHEQLDSVRLVRCVAALKLLRRCPPFSFRLIWQLSGPLCRDHAQPAPLPIRECAGYLE